jgi:SAM-dependent methyltransferase
MYRKLSEFLKRNFLKLAVDVEGPGIEQGDSNWEVYRAGLRPSLIRIRKGWRVLDVGSGHNPHSRANVLLDKYVDDSRERSGAPLKAIYGKKLVIGDVQDMPFKDKEFDFVVASHIAEHVDDPAAFCEELMRVGKAGYVETPGKIGEMILSEVFHKWYVYQKGRNTLVFERIRRYKPLGFLGALFYGLFYFNRDRVDHWTLHVNIPVLRYILGKISRVMGRSWKSTLFARYSYTAFHWKDRFNYVVS